MESVYVIVLMVVAVYGEGPQVQETAASGRRKNPDKVDLVDNGLGDTELLMSFVVFRHGDRTPDQEELDKFPGDHHYDNIFFPYGKKALTNKGKQGGFRVGEYLRKRYNNILISKIYLPEEISVRTTDYARTKMTALTALAAMFPPPPAQRWNPFLNWQPVPYDTAPHEDDDTNVGVNPPTWAQEVMPEIKEITKIEYACQFYDSELIRLSTGILLADILNSTNAAMTGDREQPNLRLYSAHENNVAALMAAIGVFKPHQPKFGSAILLEFRKRLLTGQYGFTAVYAADAGGPGVVLPISGCGGQPFCDYETFITLTKDNVLSRSEYKEQCLILDR